MIDLFKFNEDTSSWNIGFQSKRSVYYSNREIIFPQYASY